MEGEGRGGEGRGGSLNAPKTLTTQPPTTPTPTAGTRKSIKKRNATCGKLPILNSFLLANGLRYLPDGSVGCY